MRDTPLPNDGWLAPTRRELQTPSTSTLLTADEVRSHLRLSTNEIETTDAENMTTGITKLIQRYINRPLLPETWKYLFKSIPQKDMPIRLETTPIRSIDSISTFNNENTESVISTDDYTVYGLGDYEPYEAIEIWPDNMEWDFSDLKCNKQPYPLRIDVDVGWSDSNMPVELKQAALMIAGDWWSQRRSGVSVNLYHVPYGTRELLNSYRLDTIHYS